MADRQKVHARCGACGHVWHCMTLPMEGGKFARLMKRIFCPDCGTGPKNLFLADQPNLETKP